MYNASLGLKMLALMPVMIDPLNPEALPFFVFMLITPAFPEASYFDEGFVMISICSSADAGIFLSKLARSAGARYVGLPSTMTMTPAFPLRLMFPSLSTVTPGDFSKTSSAVAPALVGDDSTFTMVRSILLSIKGFFAVTITPARPLACSLMTKGGTDTLLLEDNSKTLLVALLYPTFDADTKYFPSFTSRNSYPPFLPVAANFTEDESLALRSETVAE